MSSRTKIYHVILLDRSGSMSSIAAEARTGFNEVVQQIKEDAKTYEDTQEHLACLVTFNGGVEKVFWLEDIANLEEINEKTYRPGGGTALRDAIGITISDIETDLKSQIEAGSDIKIFMTVITDGQDTASREYNNDAIKTAIEGLKQDEESSPWTLSLVGANIDAVTTGGGFGMRAGMSTNFDANAVGTQSAFNTMRATRGTYSKGLAAGYSKLETDQLVAHTSSVGRDLDDSEMDEFVKNLREQDDSKTSD